VGSFGEGLKREREKRGVTLDEIALATKIGTRMLRALEEEKFEQLPGGIFNKGFVRAYARHLSIDEEQAVADYLAAAGESRPDKKPEPSKEPFVWEAAEERDSPANAVARLPWSTLALALLLVALGFAIWSFYARHSQDSPTPMGKTQGTSSAGSEAASNPHSRPGEKAAKGSAAASAAKPPGTGAAVLASGQPSEEAAASVAGSFVVLIKAREDSWLSISADGKEIMQDTLVAPAERSVAAQREIVVKAGNVGAVEFSFNGRKLPVQGDYGQVKTLNFDPSGLQPEPPPRPQPPASGEVPPS
jgi:cytoskeletal protein RodZ